MPPLAFQKNPQGRHFNFNLLALTTLLKFISIFYDVDPDVERVTAAESPKINHPRSDINERWST